MRCWHSGFVADEHERLAQIGILGKDERIEFRRGEIVQVAPIGSRTPRASMRARCDWVSAHVPR